MTMSWPGRAAGFVRRLRQVGPREALRRALKARLFSQEEFLPFARVNPAGLFATDTDALNAQDREKIRSTSFLMSASQVEASYPLHMEMEGRVLRYAFLPARGKAKGIVLLLHGHDAFLHLGPVHALQHFDVLAPWDTFGYKRQGSWFWGEKGRPFVEALVQELLLRHRKDRPWFSMGASMGGFGALWHGIKFRADGIYAQCPQVDLARKVADFGAAEPTNPYRYLQDEAGQLPDLLGLAAEQHDLPPLFLIQNQFDLINPFMDHAWRLLDLYNMKRAWYALRIHPSIGHGGDGAQEEAELFFLRLLDKHPPRRFPSRAPRKAVT